MTADNRLTAVEGIVIAVAFVFSGAIGISFLCFTDRTIQRIARWRWNLHEGVWGSIEKLRPNQRDHLLRPVQHPEEAGTFIKGSLRVAGCGLLVFCLLLLILAVGEALTRPIG
jgi:hypothetical protein